MYEWDVFVSHASEDDATVKALAAELSSLGLRVWVDHAELRIGDSIRAKIDEGLAQSAYGVVVVSKAFLAKHWPAQEMSALFSLELDGRPRLLPVWHDVTRDDVARTSPLLSDRIAANTREGVKTVAREIAARVLDPTSPSPSVQFPSTAQRLRALIDGDPPPERIATFLQPHPWIIMHAIGWAGGSIVAGQVIPSSLPLPTFIHQSLGYTQRVASIILIHFASTLEQFNAGIVSADTERIHRQLERSINYLAKHPGAYRGAPGYQLQGVEGVVFVGRRELLGENIAFAEYAKQSSMIKLRTYDSILDSAVSDAYRYNHQLLSPPIGEAG